MKRARSENLLKKTNPARSVLFCRILRKLTFRRIPVLTAQCAKDIFRHQLRTEFDFSYKFLGRNAFGSTDPSLQHTDHTVRDEIDLKISDLRISDDLLQLTCKNLMEQIVEMFGKGILALMQKDSSVKKPIFIEILHQRFNRCPERFEFGRPRIRDKFRVKDPVHQIFLVLKMIIKAFSAHIALPADIAYADLLDRFFRNQLLEC